MDDQGPCETTIRVVGAVTDETWTCVLVDGHAGPHSDDAGAEWVEWL